MKNLNKKIFVIIMIAFSQRVIVHAQNLVPNPSFEDTISCPDGLNEVNRATGWSSFGNTPDYLNACSQVMNVPYTSGGYQNAFDGNAFCGVYTYYSGATGALDYREYIGAQLTSSLNIGQKYFITFELNKPNDLECATNNFGALFSTVQYTETNPVPINTTPKIIETQIITDTLNWVTISGSFIADSNYNFVILGNFYSDSNTSKILYNGQMDCIAYYFIDMVCVSRDSLICNTLVQIPKVTFIDKINIFPNPVNNSLYIEYNYCIKKPIECYIFDSLGRLVSKTLHFSDKETIDVSKYLPGIYIFHFVTDNKILNKKLIVKI